MGRPSSFFTRIITIVSQGWISSVNPATFLASPSPSCFTAYKIDQCGPRQPGPLVSGWVCSMGNPAGDLRRSEGEVQEHVPLVASPVTGAVPQLKVRASSGCNLGFCNHTLVVSSRGVEQTSLALSLCFLRSSHIFVYSPHLFQFESAIHCLQGPL